MLSIAFLCSGIGTHVKNLKESSASAGWEEWFKGNKLALFHVLNTCNYWLSHFSSVVKTELIEVLPLGDKFYSVMNAECPLEFSI